MSALVLMLSLSLVLRAVNFESFDGLEAQATGLFVFGVFFLVLVYGLWSLRKWTRTLAFVLLPTVTIAGIVDSMGNDVMSLGSILVFGLTFVTNIVVILALQRPETRVVFKR